MGKRKKSLRLLAAVLLLGTVLSACGEGEPAPTPTPTQAPAPTATAQPKEFALPCYPEAGFHPIQGSNRTNLALGGLLYDGLYELDQTFMPQPALATGYTVSSDGLSWTFALRGGVTFSDGTPMTAADVAASLTQAKNSVLYGNRLAGISSAQAGEGSVTVRLTSPNGNLPALLDVPVVRETGGTPLGTGSYVLQQSGESYILQRRNDGWHTPAPALETIPLRTVEEANDLLYAFDTQEISLVGTDFTGVGALGFSGSFETVDYPTANMLYIGFNTARGPCRDAAVRRALGRGMNRDSICSALLSRHAVAATLPAHPASGVYDPETAGTLKYSPQEMDSILTQAGWSRTDGSYQKGRGKLELTLLVNQDNSYKTGVADAIGRDLTAAGVSVTVKKLSWEDFTAALSAGDFDLYLGEVKMSADFDPSPLLGGGALNYGKYNDPTAAGLLSAFRAAQGEERQAAAKALYERLGEQAPFAVLCFKNWSMLTQWGQVSNATPTQQNLFCGFGNWSFAN